MIEIFGFPRRPTLIYWNFLRSWYSSSFKTSPKILIQFPFPKVSNNPNRTVDHPSYINVNDKSIKLHGVTLSEFNRHWKLVKISGPGCRALCRALLAALVADLGHETFLTTSWPRFKQSENNTHPFVNTNSLKYQCLNISMPKFDYQSSNNTRNIIL